ncbi:selenoprotein, putative (Sel3), partial [Plasmodium malariae]
LPNEDDDYLGKLINVFNNICNYSVNNKAKITKILTTSLLSAYSINSLYNSGVTFKKSPHYSLYVPSNIYIKNLIKKLKKNYELKTNGFTEHKIFEKTFTYDNINLKVVEMYVVNNIINFSNFLPDKFRKESSYKFLKYKEFENVENLFNCVKVLMYGNEILIFQGKLKKHFWIHLPLKYQIVKTEEDTNNYTLTFIPLQKYYSNYIIEIKIKKEKSSIKYVTYIKSREKKNDTNMFHMNIVKSIATYLTYDIFEGINNNIHIFYKRNLKYNKMNFIRSKNLLRKKTNSNMKLVFPIMQTHNFKIKRY